MGMILLLFLALSWITPMFGLMVVLSLIRLLVFPPLVLGSLLTSLTTAGVLVAGVWHGWLLMLPGVKGASPLAVDASESAFYLVEVALGRYSSNLVAEWSLPDGFDAEEVSARMPESPEVWSDGSLVLDSVTGVSAAGAGLFAHQSDHCWRSRRWGHVDRVLLDRVPHSCRGLVSVPGPLQTVQRAELWLVILAYLCVVRHVGRLLDDRYCSSLF